MNSVKLQDTKSIYRNQLHFYTLIMNSQKQINNPIYHYIKKNKVPRNKFNQGGERPVC